ncbi:hypothetical protein D3C71_1843690 [compost metagenome]
MQLALLDHAVHAQFLQPCQDQRVGNHRQHEDADSGIVTFEVVDQFQAVTVG